MFDDGAWIEPRDYWFLESLVVVEQTLVLPSTFRAGVESETRPQNKDEIHHEG